MENTTPEMLNYHQNSPAQAPESLSPEASGMNPTNMPNMASKNSSKNSNMALLGGLALIILIAIAGFAVFYMQKLKGTTQTASQTSDQSQKEVTFIGQAAGIQADYDVALLKEFTDKTGIKVNYVRRPQSVTDTVKNLEAGFAAHSTDIDVFQIDTIWPGTFADDMIDLKPYFNDRLSTFFTPIVQNDTVDGKLIGVPYYADAGVLYYRTDLLQKYGFKQPPKTWAELEKMAKTIQDGERKTHPHFWGYIWQGNLSESLTCNAIEWQASMGGGTIIDDNKNITVNNSGAIQAFDMAHKWIGMISPPEVTTVQEEDARQLWQSGDAAFMRNWPYAYALGQAADSPIKGKFAVTLLPSGGKVPGARNADTLGGWQLGVSKYSKHQAEAIELIKFLTSPDVQKRRSIEKAYSPVISSLYTDPDVLSANPYYKDLAQVLAGGAVSRPSSQTKKLYPEVSDAYAATVHDILLGKVTAKNGLTALEQKLVTITQFPIKAQ